MNKLASIFSASFVVLALSGAAQAHVKLTSTMPVDGALLAKSPKMAMLHFDKPTRVVRISLRQGKKPIALKFRPSKKASKMLHVDLPKLGAGNYKLSWVLLGKDGHKMKDDLNFSVK